MWGGQSHGNQIAPFKQLQLKWWAHTSRCSRTAMATGSRVKTAFCLGRREVLDVNFVLNSSKMLESGVEMSRKQFDAKTENKCNKKMPPLCSFTPKQKSRVEIIRSASFLSRKIKKRKTSKSLLTGDFSPDRKESFPSNKDDKNLSICAPNS